MRHRKKGTTLDRTKAAREALLRDLATSLVLHGKVRTTEAKAKAVRPYVERMVSIAKKGGVANRRLASQFIRTPQAVSLLMDTLGPRLRSRSGGSIRIVKLGYRRGDGAPTVLLELVS